MNLEWFVAWRHLRDPERKLPRTLIVGLVLLVIGIAAWIAAHRLGGSDPRPYDVFSRPRFARYAGYIKVGAVIEGALALAVVGLGTLFRYFTVFTSFSVFGVFLGTFAPIFTLSVMSGFEADLKTKIRGTKADVVISAVGDQPFTRWSAVADKLRNLPGVVGVTPFIEAEIMVRSGQTPAGLVLRGVDPASAPSVLDIGKGLREGTLDMLSRPELVKVPAWKAREQQRPAADGALDELPPRGVKPKADEKPAARPEAPLPSVLPTILLGEELYQRMLRVFVGDEVDVLCPTCGTGPTGPIPRLRRFRVAGHFYTGMYEFDSKLAYVSLPEAQRFLSMPDEITGLDIRTATPETARAVADTAQAILGAHYEARAWEDMNKSLFLALKIEKIAMFVVLTLILLVASFSILSNLFMMVTEKGREVAILKAMGSRDQSILRVFFIEGLYIGLLGLIPGVACGVLTCLLAERFGLRLPSEIYYIEQLPVVMRPAEIVAIAGIALAMCCLATLSPAYIASRLRPVEGLRYE